MSAARRGSSSKLLWVLLWCTLTTLLSTQIMDSVQRAAPAVVWVLKLAPLVILLPGVWRDRLRSVIWLSFVSLMYFVLAVERLFAEPDSLRAQLELMAVILLFLSSMFYLRLRGPEQRAESGVVAEVGEDR
ncbi:MAG: putative membrane protein [Halieaceae bacterium]|jgi:uncharacterized membrane protein